MKILMLPGEGQEGDRTTGISRVVYKYVEYLKKDHGVEFVKVDQNPDLIVGHAGITGKSCDVSILHGMYWTGDYNASKAEHVINAKIADSVRAAKEITVPSDWVRKTIERDLRIKPTVIHHGIEWDEWQEEAKTYDYILWSKNRLTKICDPTALQILAKMFPSQRFMTTFAFDDAPDNIEVIGKQPFDRMKKIVKSANIYLSLVKETFGIGTLEAMASGVPVLGWDYGGNVELVKHGVSGYLAEPYNYKDLQAGLEYCLENREVLGKNAREAAKKYTWRDAVNKLYAVLERANKSTNREVSVIIPVYNYADKVGRAIESACEQTLKPKEIIVVDDGSKDNPKPYVDAIAKDNPDIDIKYIRQENAGVAIARNTGFKNSTGEYICCLDADDKIRDDFLRMCVASLERNPDVYVSYTRLWYIKPDGDEGISNWPSDYVYDKMLQKHNQVPTCNVARRSVWERLGGQRQRYAPMGAGSEDAEMWLRAGAYGMGAKLATSKPLFVYSWLSGIVSGNKDYQEIDFRLKHPWANDEIHPFASLATPRNKVAHPIFQYDNPLVSIIIPVAERHLDKLVDALDSVESQSFRKWEIVVIDDSKSGIDEFVSNAYPFVTWAKTPKPNSGAAVARNIGASLANSELYLFLDADDEFAGEKSLEIIMNRHYKTGDIVYTDYTVKLKAENEKKAKEEFSKRFIGYNKYTKALYLKGHSLSYDCERAQEDFDFNWCIISCLVPKEIHDDINGFDESLQVLEDVDYYKRIAKKGYCFERLEEPCFLIDRTRPLSEEKTKKTIEKSSNKIKHKLKGIENMACRGCGNREVSAELAKSFSDSYKRIVSKTMNNTYDDKEFVRCEYQTNLTGDHKVIGTATRIKYGYKSSGDIFLVHRNDIAAHPSKYVPVSNTVAVKKKEKANVPPPPAELEKLFDADMEGDGEDNDAEDVKEDFLDGRKHAKVSKDRMTEPLTEELLSEFGATRYTDEVLSTLKRLGVETVGLLPTLTVGQLTDIKGIGKVTAEKIKKNAVEYYEK